MVAAGVAFYGLMALFPALTALVSIYGLIATPADVQQQVGALSDLLPQQAQAIVSTQLEAIATGSSRTLSFSLAASLLLTIWSSTKGTKSLMTGLNVAYEQRETRGFLRTNLVAVGLTVAGILFVILSLLLVAAIPAAIALVPLASLVEGLLSGLRWPLLALLGVGGLAAFYRYAPDRRPAEWRWVLWGAAAATVAWLIACVLFSWYVANFGSYNKTYGALGAVIVLLLWLWLSAYILLLGAELNSEMERQAAHDTTGRPERASGPGGAHVADHAAAD